MIWVLESEAFRDSHAALRTAAAVAGQRCTSWTDEYWLDGGWPRLNGERAVFHGSLGNAARIRAELPWTPGAYCDVEAFRCASWYPRAAPWLLHEAWKVLPARALVADSQKVMSEIGANDAVFVRPDSPLKPFAGRVLQAGQISLAALDHGFYYDDAELPIVVAPVRQVGREWRYVVAGGRVVAGSAYAAEGRSALPDDPGGEPWRFAAQVAGALAPPEVLYVMDVCEVGGALRLLELNPFSGADLYGCDAAAVVAAVARVAGG